MISGKLILTVGDDETLRQILVEQLQLNGEFRIKEALTGKEALQYTEKQYFDGVLLDVELNDFNAYEICCQMRKNGVKAPIIIISDANNDQDTILGLDSGANDFVVKPIKIAILLARLRAHIRQYEQNEHAVLNFGTYSFRPGAKVLLDTKTNKEIRLTDKETAIIKFLYLSSGQVVSKSVLLDEVWGYNAGMTTHTLETHVYRLRQKIERDPSKTELLVTEANGYRLAV